MKEKTAIKILLVFLTVSLICNIIGACIVVNKYQLIEGKNEMEQLASCDIYFDEQSSYDRAFSEWGDFDCAFDNTTLTLETECGGHGFTSITIFSNPKVNISIDYWDVYKTVETWTEKNIDEIWIKDAEENTLVIPKEWLTPEDHPSFFDFINISVPVWNFYVPASSWTQHVIDVQDNISSNLTIVVRKDISPFSYMDTIYRFQPAICVFEVRT